MNEIRDDKSLTTAMIAGKEPPPPPRDDRKDPAGASRPPLLAKEALEDLRGRWTTIQSAFVDEPRRAVEQADGLVAELMKRIAEVFANERSGLESQWGSNGQVDTENLRIALQRYRSFFDRLLDV